MAGTGPGTLYVTSQSESQMRWVYGFVSREVLNVALGG